MVTPTFCFAVSLALEFGRNKCHNGSRGSVVVNALCFNLEGSEFEN
jgi:hypothetical protein